MIRKLTLAAGFGAGYLLGAKAGTERYEQIVAKAREFAGMPAVQEATANLQQTASTMADKAKDTVNETVASVSGKVDAASASATGSTGSPAGGGNDVLDLGAAPMTGAAASATAPTLTTPPLTTPPLTTPPLTSPTVSPA